MTFLQRNSANISYLTGILAIIPFILHGTRYALKPKSINIIYDKNIAKSIQTQLSHKIEQFPLYLIGADALYEYLKKEYPIISSISISYKSSRVAQIEIKALKPYIRILSISPSSKEYVLTKENIFINHEFFNSKLISKLATLIVEGNLANLDISTSKLPLDLFDKYNITWHSKMMITLTPKSNIDLMIIADLNSIASDRIAYAERIYEVKRKLYKYNKGIKADVRFKNGIVCGPLGGGKQ